MLHSRFKKDKILKSTKILNLGFWKDKILNAANMLHSGFRKVKMWKPAKFLISRFWKPKILKSAKMLNQDFGKLRLEICENLEFRIFQSKKLEIGQYVQIRVR